jgi:hypothetical protein
MKIKRQDAMVSSSNVVSPRFIRGRDTIASGPKKSQEKKRLARGELFFLSLLALQV